ncbi:DUF1214 domain-containing protein [Croceicoccus sp. F390]|uniref:DUF1214 domain-containing protein n=1 Tax=Croceicoccus esteveae TaxID=3075597 RepID=A0ABU2ZKL0_9SPHN|nr:DUF1214 domain-containing protein [Croceicoccus sp. F390]MDT0577132.1 DUF1214 domain-containing protein [Croceicoccus sp. F390]
MPEQYEQDLKAAWDRFCDELKEAGDIALRKTAASNPVDRAAGFRLLSRNIALALQFEMENDDPQHPELLRYFDPLRKQGGDNTDALYVGAPINGTDTYRVSGTRGQSRYFGVTVVEKGDTPWGGGVAGSLFGDEIETDEDGNFELYLSPDPQPGNWIKTTPDTFRVTFRQFFADWEGEAPMEARIDRLSGDGAPPQLAPETVIDGFGKAAHWLQWSVTYWADMIEKWKAQPNRFLSYRQLDNNKIDATPGGEPLIAYWMLPADEALIIRVTPPKAHYWAVEFGNYWWETMDYRYRLCSTNCHHATLEDDGELIVVVSHDDPGVPNWLDPSGHSEGYVTYRWMMADNYPVPECEQVKRATLLDHLPAKVKRITPQERREQLEERRRGVVRRFKW